MDRGKRNNKSKFGISGYIRKSNEKHIKVINKMMRSEENITFKSSCKYFWSLIALGVNWMVYKKVFVALLTVMVLAGALVWSPILGIILCLLAPIALGMYGKRFYLNVTSKYENIQKSDKQRLIIPSSLVIIWVLIIFVAILLIFNL